MKCGDTWRSSQTSSSIMHGIYCPRPQQASNDSIEVTFKRSINIEAHTHGTSYQMRAMSTLHMCACTLCIVRQSWQNFCRNCLTCMHMHSNPWAHAHMYIYMYLCGMFTHGTITKCNSYVYTQDVPVRERDSWMWTPMYMTISTGHECPLWLHTSDL